MLSPYDIGRVSALADLGLVKTATPSPVAVQQSKDPFLDVQRKLKKIFQVKMPKFDVAAQLKRLTGNPLKQPQLHISGGGPALRM